MVTRQQENFIRIAPFDCRVWVRPPRPAGQQKRRKLYNNSRKGIFLGFFPNRTKNIKKIIK